MANQAPETELTDLPVELLQNIFSRSDLLTLVYCTATSKLLRRAITDQDFILQLRHDAERHFFVPSLLVGMFFQHDSPAIHFEPALQYSNVKLSVAPPPPGGGHDDIDRQSTRYLLLASRAGLVVLYAFRIFPVTDDTMLHLCVLNPVTNHYIFLPRPTVFATSHVLLSGDGDGDEDEHANSCTGSWNEGIGFRSFRLLAMDSMGDARSQTFTSRTGTWGPVSKPPAHLGLRRLKPVRCSAVVLRGVAHWLYHDLQSSPLQRYTVLAIRVGTGQATTIEVPPHCLHHRKRNLEGELLLVRSVDGRLGLLVAEANGIAMWTLSEDDTGSWARHVVVERGRMLRSLAVPWWKRLCCCLNIQLEWFGEASGTAVLRLQGVGVMLLKLQTGEVSHFIKDPSVWEWDRPPKLWYYHHSYEMDLISSLVAMKRF